MQSNTFGDAANGIVLQNGGELEIGGLGASYVLNRSITGQGTVDTGSNGLTLGAGSIDIATIDDLISIAGQLTLDASSILNVTAPFAEGDYVIVSSDTGLSGTFGTPDCHGGSGVPGRIVDSALIARIEANHLTTRPTGC